MGIKLKKLETREDVKSLLNELIQVLLLSASYLPKRAKLKFYQKLANIFLNAARYLFIKCEELTKVLHDEQARLEEFL